MSKRSKTTDINNELFKCPIGVLGRPRFSYKDTVGLYVKPYGQKEEIFCIGNIYIINAYGTIEQSKEPSYDIMVENYNNSGQPCLLKHYQESDLYSLDSLKEKFHVTYSNRHTK